MPRENSHAGVFVKGEPNWMNMKLNILPGCLESVDDALHWLIAEIEIVGALNKK